MENNTAERFVTPLASVVLPVFNAEKTICKTISKLIEQTYGNIEFIVINDGSSDGSLAAIHEAIGTDTRFRVITRENKGLIYSLNEGFDLANGKYIVREDADDYSDPERVAVQVQYMERNTNVVVAGCQTETFGAEKKRSNSCTSPEDCKALLLFYPPVSHPATIIRQSFLDQHSLRYSEAYKHCEDFALWVDIVKYGGQLANVDQLLHYYHIHPDQASVVNSQITLENHYKIVKGQLQDIGITDFRGALEYFVVADQEKYKKIDNQDFKQVLELYQNVITKNNQLGKYTESALEKAIVKNIKSVIGAKLGMSGFVVLLRARINLGKRRKFSVLRVALIRSTKEFVKKNGWRFMRSRVGASP
jgi:glycosyltransferase involved in cell wall biosynthesis